MSRYSVTPAWRTPHIGALFISHLMRRLDRRAITRLIVSSFSKAGRSVFNRVFFKKRWAQQNLEHKNRENKGGGRQQT